MARIRTIKPEFWTSEQVVECSPTARLLFIGLWNFCDDAGNHPASAKTIKMQVFPGDDLPLSSVESLLQELVNNGLLDRYDADGKQYFHVTGWHHQKIEKPSIKYPKPSFADRSPTALRSFADDQPPEGKGREGKVMDVSSSDTDAQEDDEARLREMLDKQRQEQDERVRFLMTADWAPDSKILNSHLRTSGSLGMANGKPVTFDDLTDEILDGFKASAFRKQERRTKHDWHGGLARYLANSLKNGPKPENVYQIPSKPTQEPVSDGPGWMVTRLHVPIKMDEPTMTQEQFRALGEQLK